MIPQNFPDWHKCITQDCKIALTKTFVEQRIAIYTDEKHPETIKFKSRYGDLHLNNIIDWLHQVKFN